MRCAILAFVQHLIRGYYKRSMQYYLYPPFFVIEPQISFDEAWEVF